MSTVTIGSVLRLEGAVDVTTAGSDSYLFVRYHRLVFLDEKLEFVIDVEPEEKDRPSGFRAESLFDLQKDQAEGEPTPVGAPTHFEIGRGKTALFRCYVKNPLTPFSRGYWLHIRIIRRKSNGAYQLKRAGGEYSRIYYQRYRDWYSTKIGTGNISVANWQHENFRMAARLGGRMDNAIKQCVMLNGRGGSLINAKGYEYEDVKQAAFELIGWPQDGGGDTQIVRAVCLLSMPSVPSSAAVATLSSLGLNDRQDVVRRSVQTRIPIYMQCTRVPQGDTEWILDWESLPTSVSQDSSQLSFRTLWQYYSRAYSRGLFSLNAKSHLGFLPTDVHSHGTERYPWTFRFRIRQREGEWQTELEQIFNTDNTSLDCTLGAAEKLQGEPLEFSVVAGTPDPPIPRITEVTTRQPRWLLNLILDKDLTSHDIGSVLVGGVILPLKKSVPGGSIKLARQNGLLQGTYRRHLDDILGDAGIAIELELTFSALRPLPATEDPERGFEVDAYWLRRERSIVFDLTSSEFDTTVEVRERATSEQSRKLSIILRTDSPMEFDSNVVVIDPSPLRIARAKAKSTTSHDGIIAIFTDTTESSMQWEFQTDSGEITLTLPPQSVGEEMIKARLSIQNSEGNSIPVPLRDELFDFRLSPSAQLLLDRTSVVTARAPAPWNLRRVLNRRDAEVGVQVKNARFELLYGLTVELLTDDKDALRLADLDASVGAIPFPSALLKGYDHSLDSTIIPTVESRYASDVAQWIRSLLYYPAELKLFRQLGNRDNPVIEKNLKFSLRSTRQSAHPISIGEYHPKLQHEKYHPTGDFTGAIQDVTSDRLPLRGGVDYGFESETIYSAVLNHDKTANLDDLPGALSNLSFGTLGGTGCQEAQFDEGRTLIISKTTKGRLDTLTIVRIGRISMLWNHARHVIVYERSTRTAPRFSNDQPTEFEGLAALRKVREFIEITQNQRSYPDTGSNERYGGPLIGSYFETVIVPVRAEWGRDIKNGFVMPLAGPVPPDVKHYYPPPNVYLDCARSELKGGKINLQIKSVERLQFYTSTQRGDGSNPDGWRARADVDFPLTDIPAPPNLPSLPSFETSTQQPDAQPNDFGLKRFTMDLNPGQEGVNLMHGRPLDSVEAVIHNISLARGRPRSLHPSHSDTKKVSELFSDTGAATYDGLNELNMHLSRLAKDFTGSSINSVFREKSAGLKLLNEIQSKLSDLKGEIADLPTASPAANAIGKASEYWKDNQDAILKNSQRSWNGHIEDVLNHHLSQVWSDVTNSFENSSEGKTAAISKIRVALDIAKVQTSDTFSNLQFLPNQALNSITAVIGRSDVTKQSNNTIIEVYTPGSQHKRVESLLTRLETDLHNKLADIQARFANDGPVSLEQELRHSVRSLSIRLDSRLADTVQVVKDELGPLFQDLPFTDAGKGGPVNRIVATIENLRQALINWSTALDQHVIPPFEIGTPDWEYLHRELSPQHLLRALKHELEALASELLTPLKQSHKPYLDELDRHLAEVERLVENKADKYIVDIINAGTDLPNAGQTVLDNLRKDIKNLGDKFRKQLNPVDGKLFNDAVNQLKINDIYKHVIVPEDNLDTILDTEIIKHLDELKQQLQSNSALIEDVADHATQVLNRAIGSLAIVGERIERAVIRELDDTIVGAEESVLEVLRVLGDGPVTDTLACTREQVAYYYNAGQDFLNLTQSGALFNDIGSTALNSLSAQIPFDKIRERILPNLKDFDLNKLFPDFAGLKLEHLFNEIKIPEDPLAEYDWIDLRHGFDRHRLSAWTKLTIKKKFDEDMEVFNLSPLALSIRNTRFDAESLLEGGKDQPVTQKTKGSISADWVVDLNGEPILSIEKAALVYTESGDLDFDFEARNLQLAPALQFLTDALSEFFSPVDGLSITPVAPGGIRAELSLPVPDIGTGAFTMTGITIYTHFDLMVAGGFEVGTGFWLSRPERPFGIAILFLGGGGWFGVDVRYQPAHVFETRVSIGLSAGAMIALNFGIARGSAGLLFTVGIDFYRNWSRGGSGDTVVSIGLLIWGEFSILGIASAYLRLLMRIEYRNGSMTGYGRLTVRIKICWCFTLSVDSEVRKQFSGQSQSARAASLLAFGTPVSIEQAVDAEFNNIDW